MIAEWIQTTNAASMTFLFYFSKMIMAFGNCESLTLGEEDVGSRLTRRRVLA